MLDLMMGASTMSHKLAKTPGRPSKLTPEVTDAIAGALRAGQTVETAASLAGVSARSIRSWLRQGAEQDVGLYATFHDRVRNAIAEAESAGVDLIVQAGTRDWKAAAWLLERKNPKQWRVDVREILQGELRVVLQAAERVLGDHPELFAELLDEIPRVARGE